MSILPNAILFPLTLSEISGEQSFYYSITIGAASSLLKDGGMEICNYQDIEMKVQCINLDEWACKHGVDHIDFIWLDIEGNELPVLKSASTILIPVKAIITEVNFLEFRQGCTQYQELYDFLIVNGFRLYRIWGNPKWQGNALFVR